MRARLLILSFDDISIDPRVIKQVRRFVDEYEVTTCSPGPKPDQRVADHIELDVSRARPRGRWGELVDDVAREREWFGWTYRQHPLVRQATTLLRSRRFDAVLANDAETIGVAFGVVGPTRVHADLHEFYPGLPVEDSKLGRRQRRYWTWLIRRFASRAVSSTTVGAAIAERYHDYGLSPDVVTNAAPYRDAETHPTGTPIRLVHSGNPFKDRGLAEIMRAVASSAAEVTLDLYLTYNPPMDREELQRIATDLGSRITIHEPVPQAELIGTLQAYDVGIHVLPPTSENNALALPNKFFDFVQARLGIIVGPSLEMARIVRETGAGIVTADFQESSIREALEGLTPARVDEFKAAVQKSARAQSAQVQVEVWAEALQSIISSPAPR